MPATQSAPRNINDLFDAGKNVKDNEYIIYSDLWW